MPHDVKELELPKITGRSDIKEVRLVKTDGTSVSMEISTFIKEIALEIARTEGFASVVAELITPVMSKLDETGNLNNLVSNGIYTAVNTSDIDKVSTLNYPTNNNYWLVIVFLVQQITFQIAVNIENNEIYSRISNDLGKNWKVWKSL